MINEKIRNIAIIAHVDHGKTTLVDAMFKQSGLYRAGQQVEDRAMDSMELERERGITIAAKNCSVFWEGVKVNIIDTPGHADFGGEVERALSMASGAILLVDASEGPLPQTRFVLEKTLEANLKVIVVINKIDRADARINEVTDEIYDLFIDLGANDEQMEFSVLLAIGKEGIAKYELNDDSQDLKPLFQTILNDVPGPSYDEGEPFQMLVADLGYSDYLGRLAIGRVFNGQVQANDRLICVGAENKSQNLKVSKLQTFIGLSFTETDTVAAGEIAVLAGIDNVAIGDTICHQDFPKALKRIVVDEPVVSMRFTINTSPYAGQEGKLVQSSKIRERLTKETLLNVSLQVEFLTDRDSFIVKGRGEFQIAILIETMRREGFELTVGPPEVIYRYKNRQKMEPIEQLFIDCDENFVGIVTQKLSSRHGKMMNLVNHGSGRTRMEFNIPSRALIGYRDEFLTDTRGTGIMNSISAGYGEFRGDFLSRYTGSIVSDRYGKAVPYALYNLEPRGRLFTLASDLVYEGMIIGEHNKEGDINVNPTKEKKLSNVRSSGKDEAVILSPIKPMTLEAAINFIRDDEMVEVTPKSIRLRKTVLLAQKRHHQEAIIKNKKD